MSTLQQAREIEARLKLIVSDKPKLDVPMKWLEDRGYYVILSEWEKCYTWEDFDGLEPHELIAGEYVLRTGEEE